MKAIINPDRITCTTLNPYGYKAYFIHKDFSKNYDAVSEMDKNRFSKDYYTFRVWQQAEAERKTYEIELCEPCRNNIMNCEANCFQSGTVHEIEIVNCKARIK